MCKRRTSSADFRNQQPANAYTGETISLGTDNAPARVSKPRHCGTGRFPFWTLWLIWPLIGLVKGSAPVVAASLVGLTQIVVVVLPVVLIIVGIMLLRRS